LLNVCVGYLAVEFNLTNTYPLANNLSLDGVDVDGQYLFQPLLKVFGYKTRNLDGSEAVQEYDENNQRINYVAAYYLLPLNMTSDSVVRLFVANELAEGYYYINTVISVASDYKTLIALNGKTALNQSDHTGAQVNGKTEAIAKQIGNDTELGVQYSPTRLSQIKAKSSDTPIKVSEASVDACC
jgi:hypothetical protein